MDYSKHITVQFSASTDGHAVTTFIANIFFDIPNLIGYMSDSVKNELCPDINNWDRATPSGHPSLKYRYGRQVFPHKKISCKSSDDLQKEVSTTVETLKTYCDNIERRNNQISTETTNAADIVKILSLIDFTANTTEQISTIARKVANEERKNTLSLVRERLSKITYGKSAIKAISDL